MTYTKSYSKNSIFDKFFTNTELIPNCIFDFLELNKNNKYLEPSAGNGALLEILKNENVFACDISPDLDSIKKIDFLKDFESSFFDFITFMNPPFGRNSNLAIPFFNKASIFSKKIICIVPRTFRKKSVLKKLNKNFHLIFDEDFPDFGFFLNSEKFDVKSCIQVWERKNFERIIDNDPLISNLFSFGSYSSHDFAVRRAGSKAGSIVFPDSNVDGIFWINGSNEIKNIISNIDFSKIVSNTSGIKSLSKRELISEVEKAWNSK